MLRGKRAVVTGGASGIGRATAELLAAEGAAVTVGDVAYGEGAEEGLARRGIVPMHMDVRCEDDMRRMLAQSGDVDLAVHSAGVVLVRPVPEVAETEWSRVMDVNLKGAFLLAKHAIPGMQRRGGGCIVFVSSNAGLLPRAHDPVYSTSKGSLQAFMRALALAHSRDRIRVNAVCPGPVSNTRIMDADVNKAGGGSREEIEKRFIQASPLASAHGRMIRPQEVAQAIAYLASDAAVMVTGTSIAIDGGKSLGVPPPAKL